MYLHVLAALSSELQCCVLNKISFDKLHVELGIETNGEVFIGFNSECEYLLQGQDFCGEIKVNLVTGNVLCM